MSIFLQARNLTLGMGLALLLAACGGPGKDSATDRAERNAPFLVEPVYPSREAALEATREILQPTDYLSNDFVGQTFEPHPVDAPLRTLRVGLSWIANDQFAAYYVAQRNGYFRDAGFEVDLMPGGPGKNPVGLLIAGQLDFFSSSAGGSIVRLQHSRTGGDAVVVGALFRKYPYAWVGLDPTVPRDQRSHRTITAEDFRGKKLGAEPGAEYLAAYTIEQMGLGPSDVVFGRTSTQIEPLVEGAVDFMTCWVDNIPRMLEAQGMKNWFVWEFGNNGWSDFGNAIVTTRAMVDNEPELIARYLWALSRAITFIIDHPEESAQIVYDAMPGTNLTHELIAKRLAYQKELSAPIPGVPLLQIDPEKWEDCAANLLYYGVIEAIPSRYRASKEK